MAETFNVFGLIIDIFGIPAVYTPASDVAAGSNLGELVWGRIGNDILLAYQPLGKDNGSEQLDVLAGDIEFPNLLAQLPQGFQPPNKDLFILGDWRTPYYTNGSPLLLGANNFVIIPDFDINVDTIQLYGSPANYQITDLGIASLITFNSSINLGIATIQVPDLVAVVAAGNLDFSKSYFRFVGTSPAEPVYPEITQIGSTGNDISDSIAVDKFGNVWVTGSTTGTLTQNSNIGLRDVWLKKYNDKGDLLLTKQLGTPSNEAPFAIATDSEGNVIVLGYGFGDFAGVSQGLNGQVWISKFDTNGNIIWLQNVNGNGNGVPSSAFGVDVDADDNIYVSGVTNVATPPGAELPLQTDNFFGKFSSNGDVLLYSQYGRDGAFDYEDSYNIAVDLNRNSYRVGFVTSDWAGEPSKAYDGYLAKNNASGDLEWVVQIATDNIDWVWSVDTDSKADVVVAGWTLGSLPGTAGNLGSYDGYVIKYNSLGQELWARHIGTAGDDAVFSLKIDSNDSIYLAGYTNGAFAGATNQGSYDFWVAKLDYLGQTVWTKQYGTTETDEAYDLAISPEGDLYVTGITDGSLGSRNSGSYDTWVAKISSVDGKILDFSGTTSLSTSILVANDIVTNSGDPVSSPDLIAQLQALTQVDPTTFGQRVVDPITDSQSSPLQSALGLTQSGSDLAPSANLNNFDPLALGSYFGASSSQAPVVDGAYFNPVDPFTGLSPESAALLA